MILPWGRTCSDEDALSEGGLVNGVVMIGPMLMISCLIGNKMCPVIGLEQFPKK